MSPMTIAPAIGRRTERSATTDRIAWKCDACGQSIEDGSGYIWVDRLDTRRYEAALIEWRRKRVESFDRGQLSISLASDDDGYPSRPRWRVHHRRCDATDTGSEYLIGVERCRTHAQLLDWTAHLLAKDWMPHTAWDQLIRRAIGRVDA